MLFISYFYIHVFHQVEITMTINFYLDSKMLHKNEKNVICFIRGIEKKKTTYIKTNIKINPESWNSDKQNVRRNHPNSTEYNAYLEKFRNSIQLFYLEYISNYREVELSKFRESLMDSLFKAPVIEKSKTFYEIFELYKQTRRSAVTKNTFKNYITLQYHLIALEKHTKSKITFDSIDVTFFDNFNDYSWNVANHTNNTNHSLHVLLKAFLTWAYERNYHKNTNYKKFKSKEEKVESIYLTENELMRLFDFDLSNNISLQGMRDVFCLSCFTGVRFSDISTLEFDDIKDDIWYVRTQKTKEPLGIPLSDFALQILNKYKAAGRKLPILSNQKSNVYLKELCKLAEMNELTKIIQYQGGKRIETVKEKYKFVSTHTARRTFITLSLEKGMRWEMVLAITGLTAKTLLKYVKITAQVKQKEMKDIWKR